VDQASGQGDYYVRAETRSDSSPPSPPTALAGASSSSLARELLGRITPRRLRMLRVALPLLVLAVGSLLKFGGEALELLPFVHSGPAHNLGADGRLDVIDPNSVFVESTPFKYSHTIYEGSNVILEADPGLARHLTGTRAGHGIMMSNGDPYDMYGALTSDGVWSNAIKEPSFRQRVLDSISETTGDEPMALSIGGKEVYSFHVRRYPSSAIDADFMVVFYEDQIVQIGGRTPRMAKQHAHSILGSLP
jgi:hypothetical protein